MPKFRIKRQGAPLLLFATGLLGMSLITACGGSPASGPGAPGGPGGPGGQGGPGSGPPPLPVKTVVTEPSSASITIDAVGSFRSPETTGVAPDISGIVVALDVPEGKEVERGHVLARIDDADSQAAVQVAEARYANAKANYDRIQPLSRDGVLSRQALDDAQAELNTAEGLLAEAKTRLGKNVVRAPFDGILGITTAEMGEHVSSGDPIVQLTRIDPLELTFTVNEDDAHRVHEGQQVKGRVGRCGAAFQGTVVALDPSVDPATRTLSVLARVPNDERQLRPGMSARLNVEVGRRENALVIPSEALVREGARQMVWVVEQGAAKQRDVVPESFSADSVQIGSGLEAGEEVVVAGHQKLRPGAPVASEPWEPIENPQLRLGERASDDC